MAHTRRIPASTHTRDIVSLQGCGHEGVCEGGALALCVGPRACWGQACVTHLAVCCGHTITNSRGREQRVTAHTRASLAARTRTHVQRTQQSYSTVVRRLLSRIHDVLWPSFCCAFSASSRSTPPAASSMQHRRCRPSTPTPSCVPVQRLGASMAPNPGRTPCPPLGSRVTSHCTPRPPQSEEATGPPTGPPGAPPPPPRRPREAPHSDSESRTIRRSGRIVAIFRFGANFGPLEVP